MSDFNDWNAKIIDEFHEKGGKGVGQVGDAILLLHSTGARSGKERINPLAYFGEDERIVIVASKGGAPDNPDWLYNLRANPDAKIEVGTETRAVRAQEITGDDYDKTWERVTAAMPGFADYQTKTTRKIPLVSLTSAA